LSVRLQDKLRIIKSVTRGADEINIRSLASYAMDCAHCSRDSLTFTGDTLHWKSPHRNDSNNTEVHPNAVTMFTLNTIYFSFAPASELKAMRQMIDEQLDKRVA
jgi:hypothetical protein